MMGNQSINTPYTPLVYNFTSLPFFLSTIPLNSKADLFGVLSNVS